jgi:hypothetical protein
MKVRTRALTAGGVLLLILALCAWYSIAANYDYSALSGTYTFRDNAGSCTLRLHADRTFEQELSHSSEIQKSRGKWHRYGEAHVSFSSEFMKLSGEEMNAEGEAHGEFEKVIGLFPTLVLAPVPNGPKLHKRLFR